MKKSMRPRQGRGEKPVQVFTFGPFSFHINQALALAAAPKYQPQPRWPRRDWVGPNIEINEAFIEQTDLTKPVIFATLILDGRASHVLIDGNHRVLKALNHQAAVNAVILDLEDTFKVLKGPSSLIQQMKQDGRRLGLLPEKL